jgi:phosphate starvation-inducible membrane PsiE
MKMIEVAAFANMAVRILAIPALLLGYKPLQDIMVIVLFLSLIAFVVEAFKSNNFTNYK